MLILTGHHHHSGSKGLERLKESAAFAPAALHTADREGVKLVIPATGTFGNFWRYFFGCHSQEGLLYWYLVDQDQGCWCTSHHTGQPPETENDPAPNVSGAEVEKP